MGKPIVAVVGRPNVGKSTFFNAIAGRRISIVEDTPGVTRDRIYADVSWLSHEFVMIDTGGIEPDTTDVILSQMRLQAELAIETADVVLFMLDGRTGFTNADEEIAMMLRKSRKPIVLAVNKVDTADLPETFYDFYSLGLGEPMPISSANRLGLGDLLDELVASFPEHPLDDYDEETLRIAFIGKPNVGKSSLINNILGENRVIVSDIAGTTRDAIDTPFSYREESYVFIDTAGIRRKSRIDEAIEHYSVIRSLTAIERSDVCLIIIDAQEGVTEQDKKIAGYAHEAGRAAMIVVNKWDLIEKNNKTHAAYMKDVRNELAFMPYAPVLFVSALTKQRIFEILHQSKAIANNHAMRVQTGLLNDIISEAILMNQPPSDKGKRLKIFYMTQVSVKPPTFVVFVNDLELAHFSYMRYLENQIRKNFDFSGTPIRLVPRMRKN